MSVIIANMKTPVAKKNESHEPAAGGAALAGRLRVVASEADLAHHRLPPLARDTSFWGMAATQFLGAFNDNLFKQLILLLATPTAAELAAGTGTDKQATAQIIFAAAFLIFSGVAGYVSDRFRKRTVVVTAKVAEIVIMLLGLVGFIAYGRFGLTGLFTVLFLMGTH